MPEVSTMKPEPSELVLCGCRSPPLELPPGPPRRFLKKSSKNSSNGEPGGNCGIAPLPSPPLASTVCVVEMLTTASITFSATSAMPSGPRASAGADTRTLAAPMQIAANTGRRRRFKAGIAPVISALSLTKRAEFKIYSAPEWGYGASIRARHFFPISALHYGEKRTPPVRVALIPQHLFHL